jgi:hypothetical protein
VYFHLSQRTRMVELQHHSPIHLPDKPPSTTDIFAGAKSSSDECQLQTLRWEALMDVISAVMRASFMFAFKRSVLFKEEGSLYVAKAPATAPSICSVYNILLSNRALDALHHSQRRCSTYSVKSVPHTPGVFKRNTLLVSSLHGPLLVLAICSRY